METRAFGIEVIVIIERLVRSERSQFDGCWR